MPRPLLVLLCLALFCACREPASVPQEFRPVAREAIALLEARVPAAAPLPPSDHEFNARVRGRVETLAADQGPMHAVLVLSTSDFGDAAVPVLAQVLGEANLRSESRIAAAEMLAVLDSAPAADVLVYHATRNPVSWIRAQCAWRLASTTQDQCVLPLSEALATELDSEARAFIERTLAHFGCPTRGAAAAPHTPSTRLELAFWKKLAAPGTASDPKARELEIRALGNLPTAFAKHLSEALRDEDAAIRSAAATALSVMGLRADLAGPALHQSLLFDRAIEAASITALGAVHYSQAAPAIVERLADRSRPLAVRLAAAAALDALETPLAQAPLCEALAEHEPLALRLAAASALCDYGRADIAVPVLSSALRESKEHSEAAGRALDRWLARLANDGNARARSIVEARAQATLSPGAFADLVTKSWKELVP